MKLQEGSYENLITQQLQQEIEQANINGLVCKKDSIDTAESPSMLAGHINRLICNRLSDEELSIGHKTKRIFLDEGKIGVVDCLSVSCECRRKMAA